MPSATDFRSFFKRPGLALFFICLVLAYFAYLAGLKNNPPGFYVDESSIAYNAYTISETGKDEHGIGWPVYFRAFGEYKNPVYIYLLAALFKVTGPGILAARRLNGTLGFFAALLFGLLALRLSGSLRIACFLAYAAMAIPWLFEISRLVFEVALLPLALILFLLLLERAQAKQSWQWPDSLAVALSLGLFTYTYSICRLLGPLLAVGLVIFINQDRWKPVVQTWLLYLVTLIPLFWFAAKHPTALTSHFDEVSYLKDDSGFSQKAGIFLTHYFTNLNLREWLVEGDQRVRHHVEGTGSLLVVPLLIALAGLAMVLIHFRKDLWWRFVVYGLVVAVIPASLTNDDFHTLRLAAFPIFLFLFMIPALQWMTTRSKLQPVWRWGWLLVVGLTLVQAVGFQNHFHRHGVERKLAFDADYPAVFDAAVKQTDEPIHLPDSSYAHAYWYAVLKGVDRSRFIRISDEEGFPEGGLVIRHNKFESRENVRVIFEQGRFIAYRAARQ